MQLVIGRMGQENFITAAEGDSSRHQQQGPQSVTCDPSVCGVDGTPRLPMSIL